MLEKEYGMKNLFEEVFKVKDFDEKLLNEFGYLEGSFSNLYGAYISNKGKELIIQYLKKNKYVSFEIINAACKIYDPIKTDDKDCKIFANTIKNNTSLENLAMVDVAPTIARLLGISFPNCDGKPIEI